MGQVLVRLLLPAGRPDDVEPVPQPSQELAGAVGSTREAVTRELRKLRDENVLATWQRLHLVVRPDVLRKIAGLGLSGPITLVLDNARYQRNAVVQALAKELGITLLFLPSYSPNLNLIERLWKFIKRRALYGRYHPTFAEFQAAINEVLDGLPTTHAERLKTLMTLNFQLFEDVSLMAA